MAEEPPKHQSWWQTLPGILTAVAGIITAATGLIVALNQAGVFRGDGKVDLERVREAMVKAQNDYHGADATSFEQIVESR